MRVENYYLFITVTKLKVIKDNYFNLEISEKLTHDSDVAKSAI